MKWKWWWWYIDPLELRGLAVNGAYDNKPYAYGFAARSVNVHPALEAHVEKHTGTITFMRVDEPNRIDADKVYIRPSSRYEKRVYVKLPSALAVGAYLSPADAAYLADELRQAQKDSYWPIAPSVRVTFEDGTTEVIRPNGGRRVAKAEVVR